MTQHKPGHEPKKEPMGSAVRLYTAISKATVPAFMRALAECEANPPKGHWQHRALSLALERSVWGSDPVERDKTRFFVEALLASKRPPQPTEGENFIGLVVSKPSMRWALPLLLKAGFTIKHDRDVDGADVRHGLVDMLCDGIFPGDYGISMHHILRDKDKFFLSGMMGALSEGFRHPDFLKPSHIDKLAGLIDECLDAAGREDFCNQLSCAISLNARNNKFSWERVDASVMAEGLFRANELGVISLETVLGRGSHNVLEPLIGEGLARLSKRKMDEETLQVDPATDHSSQTKRRL